MFCSSQKSILKSYTLTTHTETCRRGKQKWAHVNIGKHTLWMS